MQKQQAKLKRKLGLLSGISLNIGTIIGTGIFITPRGVLGNVGSSACSLIIWLLCGAMSAIGGHCFAELGTTFTESGGDYTYIYRAFGPFVAFFRVWCEVVIVRPCSLNVMAITFATYLLNAIYGSCAVPTSLTRLIVVIVLLFLVTVNSLSVKITMLIQNVTTFAKVLALAVVIVFGIYAATQSCCVNVNFDNTTASAPAISFAMLSGLHAYAGWHRLNIVLEELQNPVRNLPLAIWISMVLVTLLYLATNLSYLMVMSASEILATPAVGVVFARRMFGSWWWIMPLNIAISCFGTLNGSLFGASRNVYIAARHGHLPAIFNMVQLTHHTPVCAVAGQVALALMYLLLSVDVFFLINSSGVVFWFGMQLSIAALLYLRYKQPQLPRPYKVRLVWPILFLLVGFVFLSLVPLIFRANEIMFGLILLLTSLPAYWIGVMWQNKPAYYNYCRGKYKQLFQ